VLSIEQARQLADFSTLLQKWNAVHNLTAIRSTDEIATHHLLDSLAVVPLVQRFCAQTRARLLDVGSGGGLPGVPIAVACPDLQVTLLDAVQKKCAFLTQMRVQLRLPNVAVVHARVEKWQAPAFDIIVARAFSSLRDLVSMTRHLLAADGVWLAMKGPAFEREIADLPATVEASNVVRVEVPGLNEARNILILRLRRQPD
jgi:16S rRNA (guanine527-N7)-methyltransferase